MDDDDFRRFEPHVILRCVVGSRAYGLEHEGSDVDRRGIYLPPADLHWSLAGVPDQIERTETEECYWEVGKFVRLALKANPSILECLYTPLVEDATPLARELLDMRAAFLSRRAHETFDGYARSQFRKLATKRAATGEVKWKHAMHLIRLLISGSVLLEEGHLPVKVEEHRERLLAVRRGEMSFEAVDRWRNDLHRRFEAACARSRLPERPDESAADAFLLRARRSAL